MDTTFPMQVERVLRRVVRVAHYDLFEDRSQDPLLQFDRRGRMPPQLGQVGSEGEKPLALGFAHGRHGRSERMHPRLDLGHLVERLIPALLEFSGHQAVVRVYRIELPVRTARLVLGLLQR